MGIHMGSVGRCARPYAERLSTGFATHKSEMGEGH